jgi:hypothetical protein
VASIREAHAWEHSSICIQKSEFKMLASKLLNTLRISHQQTNKPDVIVNEQQKTTNEQENTPSTGQDSPAHLSFRRIIVPEYSNDTEPQTLRFYYRSHSKHFAPGASA